MFWIKKKINKNFWQDLKKKKGYEPILVLAPMADVTDFAFRKMIAKYGMPDALWTEFVSADGLVLAPEEGRAKLLKGLLFDKKQRPMIAQIFSSNPEYMKKAAELVEEMNFDGLDINMGCPANKVEKQLSGSAMIKHPEMAIDVINATMEGVKDVPVSVKTRLGYNEDQLEDWLRTLLTGNIYENIKISAGKDRDSGNYKVPKLITFHARTRRDLSKVPARWERISRAVEIRDEVQGNLPKEQRTLIFGNGDIDSIADAKKKASETGCDGIMVGRGIFGKPWFFNKKYSDGGMPSLKKRLEILVEHAESFDKYCGYKNFAVMRKHFKAYVEGFDGAKELRVELMETQNAREVKEIVKRWTSENKSLLK